VIRIPPELLQDPRRFNFFAALKRLEEANPTEPNIGEAALPSQEVVRLKHAPSLAFGATALTTARQQNGRAVLVSQFLGLIGPNGPLPLHLTEYVYERLHNEDDPTPAAFLDIFHHRILTLFYRAWARGKPSTTRGRRRGRADYVGSLMGVGTEPFWALDALPDDSKRYFASAFVRQRRDAESLESMLGAYFGLRFEVEQFRGGWLGIPVADRSRLGRDNCVLGVSATAGASVWSAQHRFRLRIHALNYAEYQAFLPGRPKVAALVAAVRLYTADEFDWDYQLLLERQEIPELRLGVGGNLGWNAWLGSTATAPIAEDAVLVPALEDAIRSSPPADVQASQPVM